MAFRRRIVRMLLALCMVSSAWSQGTVTAHIEVPEAGVKHHAKPLNAVLWLEPTAADVSGATWPAHVPYRLLQKSRTFLPHVLVVPVGASVAFPNEDPFFHNVFSLFEGSRFDLGLYEAGSTRNVRFTRRGVSYIFCNIHPEMGAVVLSLDTPLWAMAAATNAFSISNVPRGSYEAHLWIEGQSQASLARWDYSIMVPASGVIDIGAFQAEPQKPATPHENKFGKPYPSAESPY